MTIDGLVNMPVTADQRLIEAPTAAPARSGLAGSTVEDLIAAMDAHGVDFALVQARHGWDHPETRPVGPFATSHGVPDAIFDQFAEEAAAVVRRYPSRLAATVVLDPMGAMRTVRQLERAVRDYGFVGAALMPSATGVAPNDALCFPLYAKCVELGIPMSVRLGAAGPRRSGRLQQPILLEDVLLAFPELTLVGSHVGFPWHTETVALAQKFDNFFLSTAGWAPRQVPAEVIHLLNTRGRNRVLFASDFPAVPVERAIRESWDLPLKEESRLGYLGQNAATAYRLDSRLSVAGG